MGVTALRGDGPLARPRFGPWLPVPELVLLSLGAVVAAIPALGIVLEAALGTGFTVPAAPAWVAVGTALALLARTGRSLPRLDWLAPSLLRTLEYAAAIALLPASVWTYLWLATVAYHHYDLVYRVRTRGTPTPTWLVQALGGWEGRTLVLVALAVSGAGESVLATLVVALAATGAGEAVLATLVVALAVVLTGETLVDLRRSAPQPDPTDPDL